MSTEPFIEIKNRRIGSAYAPYVIAELSCNHRGSLNRAIRLVHEASKAGADAVKLQTFKPETHTLDVEKEEFLIRAGLWKGRSLYELYQEAVTPWEWHERLFEEAAKLDLTLFSSPGSEEAVAFLEQLGCPAYKIGSFEAVDIPLIECVARTNKPTIISTGLITKEEIAEAETAFRSAGGRQLALLHCVSAYPAPAEEFHLKTVSELTRQFGVVAGLSDHTLGSAVAVAATALGAAIVEKHMTLSRDEGGLDAAFSAEPDEMRALVRGCRTAWQAAGAAHFGPTLSSRENKLFQRSIYVCRDIPAGETFSTGNLCIVRPGFGLAPKHWREVLGRKAARALNRGTPLDWGAVG